LVMSLIFPRMETDIFTVAALLSVSPKSSFLSWIDCDY
jgi:hypothetical protein